MIQFYFMRHGESETNKYDGEFLAMGTKETPLTEEGKKQACLLGRRLKQNGIKFDEVYSSDTERTRSTAEIVCTELGLPFTVQLVGELEEASRGDFRCKPICEVYSPKFTSRWHNQGQSLFFRPPNGESTAENAVKIAHFIYHVIDDRDNITVGAFTHCPVVQCLLWAILGCDPRMVRKLHVGNCSITRIRWEESTGWHLVCLNDRAHLGK
ncbi:MAG: histidine phosphatase family protein [Parcubacteria group bacterium]|nr:histidine phosphatase family protein [Parcubacteria group bacterium]